MRSDPVNPNTTNLSNATSARILPFERSTPSSTLPTNGSINLERVTATPGTANLPASRLATQSYIQAQQLEPGNTTIAPKLALIRQLISAPVPARSTAPTDRVRPPTPAASTAR